jgi:hypothetical protein
METIPYRKINYFKSSIQNNKGNVKSIWKFIKSLGGKNKPSRLPEILIGECNKVLRNSCEISGEAFNIHFPSIASKIKSSPSPINNFDLNKLKQFVKSKLSPNKSAFSLQPITCEFVENYVLKIPSSKAIGADGISVKLLQAGIKELAPSISRLINMSLTSNQFPSRWKIARVIALFIDLSLFYLCFQRSLNDMYTTVCFTISIDILQSIRISKRIWHRNCCCIYR